MSDLPIVFPTDISYGSRGGPGYSTTIEINSAGIETRNQNWSYPRHEWDVAYGINTQAKLENLISFFHVAAGRANTFLFKDWLDYKSTTLMSSTVSATDQTIGTGDGAEDEFQLVKVYTQSGYSRTRNIYKPVTGSVRVAVDGVEKTVSVDFGCSTTTGIVTFAAGSIPTAGQVITAGFEFYVPVRFDTDVISIALEEYNTARASVPLVEVKSAD